MARFLKTSDINSCINRIIQTSQKELVLVSPFLQLSKSWLAGLHLASANDVKIIIIYGKNKNQPDKEILATIPGLTLYYMKNLHAKCYFNDQQMVIASMNLYAYSAENNKEMGILLDRLGDAQAFAEAITETKTFIGSAQQELLLSSASSGKLKIFKRPETGKCIRCACTITYNPMQPLCIDCYKKTSPISAPHYLEKYCHDCGQLTSTSVWYPICSTCTNSKKERAISS